MKITKAFNYILSDLHRYHGRHGVKEFLVSFFFHRSFIYTFWFRIARSEILILKHYALVMLKLKSWKFGIQIPPETEIGFGLYIGHGMSLIVNPSAKIGNNCNLSQFTTIGSNDGRAATIGDNVYIGPSVCVVGDICIGDNSTIGAGSVVISNIPKNVTAAGVPAKIVKFDTHAIYIKNIWLKDNC
jgi:serine O-acetyltransferase